MSKDAITFTLGRKYTLCGMGYVVVFEKDKPTYVPPPLHKAALECGANPSKTLAEEPVKQVKTAPLDEVQRQKEVFDAFAAIKQRGARGDFTAAGVPTPTAVKEQLGWELESRKRSSLWNLFMQQ